MDLPALRHFFVVAMTAGAPATVLAQEARLIAGTPPTAELPYEFTQISEVYELADGRVVVLDRLQGEVRLGQTVDPRTGKTIAVRRPVVPVDPATIRWAREVPPFRGDAFVAFAPDGKLWIQRTTFGREGGRYDIIGTDGSLIDRVRLPDNHRVVGFGRNAIYVVRRDADDLEFLQRRPLPTRQAPLRP